MEKFTSITGSTIPLLLDNVDTDAILPSRFLTRTSKTGKSGFGEFLFANWRHKTDRSLASDPPINIEEFSDAKILLAGENFGCGSSREHAVWALIGFGIRCVIASSFGEIFYNNCFKNGLLPIVLNSERIVFLAKQLEIKNSAQLVEIDLIEKKIILPDKSVINFDLDNERRQSLIKGLDPISITINKLEKIRAWQSADRKKRPWIYKIQH